MQTRYNKKAETETTFIKLLKTPTCLALSSFAQRTRLTVTVFGMTSAKCGYTVNFAKQQFLLNSFMTLGLGNSSSVLPCHRLGQILCHEPVWSAMHMAFNHSDPNPEGIQAASSATSSVSFDMLQRLHSAGVVLNILLGANIFFNKLFLFVFFVQSVYNCNTYIQSSRGTQE